MGNKIHFLTRILPGWERGHSEEGGSLIYGWPENVVLISAISDEGPNSAVLHLREISEEPAMVNLKNNLSGKTLKIIPVDVTVKHGSYNVSIRINHSSCTFFSTDLVLFKNLLKFDRLI